MSTQIDILKQAANAGGLPVEFDCEGGIGWFACGRDENGDVAAWWNPLKDDGDEARLEATLNLDVRWTSDGVHVHFANGIGGAHELFSNHNGDKQKARRYAGVFAAAKIGRTML